MADGCNGIIVVLGVTGAGKSYLVNQLKAGSVKEGEFLNSETSKCQAVEIVLDDGEDSDDEDGRRSITVIDTPGFDDTTRPDGEILSEIANFLGTQHSLGIPLKGILYLHKITDNRVTGSSELYLTLLESLVGDEAMQNVILVTTMWDMVREQHRSKHLQREQQLIDEFWKPLVDKGACVAQYDGSGDSALSLVYQLAGMQSVVLTVQKEVVEEEKEIMDTAVGVKLRERLEDQEADLKGRLAALDEQYEKETKNGNGVVAKRLDGERNKLLGIISRIARSFTGMRQRPGPTIKERVKDAVAGNGIAGQTVRVLCTILNVVLFVVQVAT